jgi:hypothetical protein
MDRMARRNEKSKREDQCGNRDKKTSASDSQEGGLPARSRKMNVYLTLNPGLPTNDR